MDGVAALDVVGCQDIRVLEHTARINETWFCGYVVGMLLLQKLLEIRHRLARRNRRCVFLVARGFDVDGELFLVTGR